MLLERRPRRVERLRRPAQVARDERDLGLGDDAPRAAYGLFRTKGASSRKATWFSAQKGSPAANAPAAAVISESI
jgi:hypothetical protein